MCWWGNQGWLVGDSSSQPITRDYSNNASSVIQPFIRDYPANPTYHPWITGDMLGCWRNHVWLICWWNNHGWWGDLWRNHEWCVDGLKIGGKVGWLGNHGGCADYLGCHGNPTNKYIIRDHLTSQRTSRDYTTNQHITVDYSTDPSFDITPPTHHPRLPHQPINPESSRTMAVTVCIGYPLSIHRKRPKRA